MRPKRIASNRHPSAEMGSAVERSQLQQVFYRDSVRLGQVLSVLYGPVPHDEAPEDNVTLEPNVYQVIWSSDSGIAWPDGGTDFLHMQQEVDENRLAVWIFPSAVEVMEFLKEEWSLDLDLPRMDN